MNVESATAIITEAKSERVFGGAMPEDDDARISLANDLVKHAQQALNAGVSTPVVQSIVSLAEAGSQAAQEEAQPPWDPDPAETNGQPAAEAQAEAPVVKVSVDDAVGSEMQAAEPRKRRKRATEAYAEEQAQRIEAEARISRERLPVPPELEDDPPALPRDFTTLSDVEVRRLHSQYHACLSRASWLLAVEESDLDAAHKLAEHAHAEAMKKLRGENDQLQVTELKASASTVKDVMKWRQRQAEHATQVRMLKALRDIYEGTVTRLSREFSMREVERGDRR